MKIWFEKGEIAWKKHFCNRLTRQKGVSMNAPENKTEHNVQKESEVYVKHDKYWHDLQDFGTYLNLGDVRCLLKWNSSFSTIEQIHKEFTDNKLPADALELVKDIMGIEEFLQNFYLYQQLGDFLDRVDNGGPFTDDDCKNLNGDWNKLRLFSNCYTIDKYITPDFKLFLRSFIQQMGSDVNLNWISTSQITDMSGLFSGLYYFNGDISQWNVSNVTNMEGMFKGCAEFNCDISGWNVEKVTNMDEMFSGCLAFDHSLKGWKIGDNTSTKNMFRLCGIDDDNKPLLIK